MLQNPYQEEVKIIGGGLGSFLRQGNRLAFFNSPAELRKLKDLNFTPIRVFKDDKLGASRRQPKRASEKEAFKQLKKLEPESKKILKTLTGEGLSLPYTTANGLTLPYTQQHNGENIFSDITKNVSKKSKKLLNDLLNS